MNRIVDTKKIIQNQNFEIHLDTNPDNDLVLKPV